MTNCYLENIANLTDTYQIINIGNNISKQKIKKAEIIKLKAMNDNLMNQLTNFHSEALSKLIIKKKVTGWALQL